MLSLPTNVDNATIAGIKVAVGTSTAIVDICETLSIVNGNTSLIVSNLFVFNAAYYKK